MSLKRLSAIPLALAIVIAIVGLPHLRFGDDTQAAVLLEPNDCSVPTPEGGWAPWANDPDGFKVYTRTVAAAQAEFDFELPMTPGGFEMLDWFSEVIYMTGSDYTVHVYWQRPNAGATGETITLYVKYGNPYPEHLGPVWWSAPGGITYELGTLDPTVSTDDLQAMACTMSTYPGPCP